MTESEKLPMWVDTPVYRRLSRLLAVPVLRDVGCSDFLAVAIDAYESGKFIVPIPVAAAESQETPQ